LSSQQQMLQPFYGRALSFRNGVRVDFECGLKAGVPKLSLGGLDGFPQLGQKRSVRVPEGVPTDTGNPCGIAARQQYATVKILRTECRTAFGGKHQVVRGNTLETRPMSQENLLQHAAHRHTSPTTDRFGGAKPSFVHRLPHMNRSPQQVQVLPPESKNLSHSKAGKHCDQDHRFHRLWQDPQKPTNLIWGEELPLAPQLAGRQLDSTCRIVLQVVPTDSDTKHLAKRVLQMSGSLPGKPLVELVDHEALELHPLDVTQAAIPKGRQEVATD